MLSGGRSDVSKQSVSEWSLHQILTGGQSYLWEQTIPIPPAVSDTFTLYPCRKIRSEFSFHPTSPRIPLSSPPRREKFVGFSFLFPKEKVHKKRKKKVEGVLLICVGREGCKGRSCGAQRIDVWARIAPRLLVVLILQNC